MYLRRTCSHRAESSENQKYEVSRLKYIRGVHVASGAKNQLPLVNDLGAPTLRDGSVGRWDGKESFFPDGFDVGGHP